MKTPVRGEAQQMDAEREVAAYGPSSRDACCVCGKELFVGTKPCILVAS